MTESELKKFMQRVAQEKGVSVEKVSEEIQASIDAIYKNPTPAALLVPRKNTVPTILEFVDYSQNILKKRNDTKI